MANTEPTWPDFDAAMAANAITAQVGLPELPALPDLTQANALSNFDTNRFDTNAGINYTTPNIDPYGFAGNTNVSQGLDPVGKVDTGYFSTNEPSSTPNITDYGFGMKDVSQGLGTVGAGSLGTSLKNDTANFYDTNASPYYNATGFGAAGASQVAQGYNPGASSVSNQFTSPATPWDYPDISLTDASRFADDPFADASFGYGDADAYGGGGRMAGGFGAGDADAYGQGGYFSGGGGYFSGGGYFGGADFGGGFNDVADSGFSYEVGDTGSMGGWGDSTNLWEEGVAAVAGPPQGSTVFGGFADANSAMGALSGSMPAGIDPGTVAGIMNAAGVTAGPTADPGANLGALAAAAALAGDEVGAAAALAAADMGGVGAEAAGAMGSDPSGGNAGNPSGAGGTGTPGTGGDSGAPDGGNAGAAAGASGAGSGTGVGSGSAGGESGNEGGGGSGGGGGGGGSFICSAIFRPGEELNLLTKFRDVFPGRDLRTYSVYGPKIVRAIQALPDGKQRLADIQTKWVNPALASIKAGDIDAAYETYCDMVQELAKEHLNKELRRHGRVRDQAA